jgi:hypothetical protein
VKLTKPAPETSANDTSVVTVQDELLPLIQARSSRATQLEAFQGILVGRLIGMREDCQTALVEYPGQAERGAIAARSTIELHRAHIGKEVVLMFEGGEPSKPIVMGVLRPQDDRAGAIADLLDLTADGERLVVTAKDQIVLRCGKASITLTKHGKVIIHGTYVSSQSSGVLRIKGGSVQIN